MESIDSLFEKTKDSFEKTLEWFKGEISSLRGSGVNINFIEDIKIDYYNSKVSLKEIASLSLLDSQTISIEPWDKSSIPNIEKALYQADLGGGIKNEGTRILFTFPVLTEEDKQKIIKILKRKTESARISLRRSRDETWKKIQQMAREGEISEDEKFKRRDDLDKLIDQFEEKIEDLEKRKEKEILS
ncbi:ribosome recycling factor [bacterium]|nr:ribosome recycling factor [bacterium]